MTTPAVESTALEGTTRATSVPSGLTEYTRGSDAPTEPARTVEGSTERRQFTQFALPPTSALAPGHEYESHARLDAEGAKHAIHDSKMLSPVLREWRRGVLGVRAGELTWSDLLQTSVISFMRLKRLSVNVRSSVTFTMCR